MQFRFNNTFGAILTRRTTWSGF